jgi:hypothetical protein
MNKRAEIIPSGFTTLCTFFATFTGVAGAALNGLGSPDLCNGSQCSTYTTLGHTFTGLAFIFASIASFYNGPSGPAMVTPTTEQLEVHPDRALAVAEPASLLQLRPQTLIRTDTGQHMVAVPLWRRLLWFTPRATK